MVVAVEPVLAADGAVGYVDIGPAVTIEVHNGDGRAHRGDFRHDCGKLGIEHRRLMHKVDAGGTRYILERKSVASQRSIGVGTQSAGFRLGGEVPHHERRREKAGEKDADEDACSGRPFHCAASLLSALLNVSDVT